MPPAAINEKRDTLKQIRFIAVIIIVAFGLIGVVYAAWVDQVVVAGNVRTADFNVRITGATCPNAGKSGDNFDLTYISGGGEVLESGKRARLWVDNIYPSPRVSHQNWQLYIKNESDIPVVLDSSSLDAYSGSNEVWNYLWGEIHLRIYDEKGITAANQIGSTVNSGSFIFKDGIDLKSEAVMDGIILYPGYTARYSILFWLHPDATEGQNEKIDFTLTYNWKQWNMP